MEIVLTAKQAKQIDLQTIKNGVSSLTLMEKAGYQMFLKIKEKFINKNTSFLLIAGFGGNGGDAYVIGRYLLQDGYSNVVIYAFKDELVKDDTEQNKKKYTGQIITDVSLIKKQYDVIIDGLFGIGLNKKLDKESNELIKRMNQIKGYKIAIDIPSGIDGNNGCAMGNYFKANLCYAIQFKKIGHYLNEGIDSYDYLEVIDIGEKNDIDEVVYLKKQSFYQSFFKKRKKNTNKGNYGKVIFISGSKTLLGAAILSSSSCAALRVGCGYSTIGIPKTLQKIYALKNPENTYVLFKDKQGKIQYDEKTLQSILNYDVIAIGMGLGTSIEVYKTLKYLLQNYQKTLIIDADALNSISEYGINILKEKKCQVVMTPHLKEFSRLTNKTMEEINQKGLIIAKEFVKKYNVLLVLKSAVTMIVTTDEVYFNLSGTPALAKAGSGDVLTGILAGIASYQHNLKESALMATYLLGKAGERAAQKLSEYSVIASDVIQEIPYTIKLLQQSNN